MSVMRKITTARILVPMLALIMSACSSDTPDRAEESADFKIGGTVSGLVGELRLVLQHPEGVEYLTLLSDGNFQFNALVQEGDLYTVKIVEMPAETVCAVDTNVRRVYETDATDIRVDCTNRLVTEGALRAGELVVVENDRAYVLGLVALTILDISNPAAPVRLGQLTFDPPSTYSRRYIAIRDEFAYITKADTYELVVVDARNPSQPVVAATHDFGDPDPRYSPDGQKIVIAGDHAYVNVSNSGLLIFDISNPIAPMEVGRFDVAGYIFALETSGDFIYLQGDHGFQIVDIQNPELPVARGTLALESLGGAFALTENHAFMLSYPDGLLVIDISTPEAPALLGRHTGYSGNKIEIDGNYAYVTNDDVGLRKIDISNPLLPNQVDFLSSSESRVFYLDFVIRGDHGFTVSSRPFDVTSLRSINLVADGGPTVVGEIALNLGSDPRGLAFQSEQLFVADFHVGLQILSMQGSTQPQKIGHYRPNGKTHALAVVDDLAYLAGTYGLEIIDIGDPQHPSRVGQLAIADVAGRIAVSGRYAYVATSNAESNGLPVFQIIDVSEPNSPIPVIGAQFIGRDVAVRDNFAYVALDGVQVLDVSEPLALREVGRTFSTGRSKYIALNGDRAIVAGSGSGRDGLHVVNISDPASLHSMGFFGNLRIAGLVADGNRAYVVSDDYSDSYAVGIHAFDVSNPMAIQRVAFSPSYFAIKQATVAGTNLFLADAAGLSIVKTQEP